jgi:MinD-like ATPase involved in chromosome partitioning or flagellar assembly
MLGSMLELPSTTDSHLWQTDCPLTPEGSPTHQDLSVLAGSPPGSANPSVEDCAMLHERLRELPHKQVVLDLPSGSHDAALDLWLGSDFPLLVAIPERLPLEATAKLLARVFARRAAPWLAEKFGPSDANLLLAEAWDSCAGRTGTWMRTVARLTELPVEDLAAHVGHHPIHLVLNRVRRADDVDVGHALVTAAGHGLGIDLRFRAVIPYQDEGWIRARRLSTRLPGMTTALLEDEVDEFLERMSSDTEVPQPGSWRWNLQGTPVSRAAEP